MLVGVDGYCLCLCGPHKAIERTQWANKEGPIMGSACLRSISRLCLFLLLLTVGGDGCMCFSVCDFFLGEQCSISLQYLPRQGHGGLGPLGVCQFGHTTNEVLSLVTPERGRLPMSTC